jgi:hypothetical protein
MENETPQGADTPSANTPPTEFTADDKEYLDTTFLLMSQEVRRFIQQILKPLVAAAEPMEKIDAIRRDLVLMYLESRKENQ